jgi:fructoselysine and glucoselysine-specific PTS system IID component
MTSSGKTLTEKDLKTIFIRSCALEASWNFERQQHMGFGFAMMPALEKIYSDNDEEKKKAAQRHLEFFNTAPPLSTFIMGIVASMEEENAKNPDEFDTSTITSIKTALMGPLAGIGDSMFWGTLLVIGIGVGASLAKEGNILGPILFLLIFNVPNFVLRYFGVMQGYKFGTKLLENIESSGIMKTLTHAASILGLMVIGGMSGSMVSIQVAGSIGQGEGATSIQSIIDGILPNMLSVLCVFAIYWMLKKGFKTTHVLFGIFILGIIAAFFGFLTA